MRLALLILLLVHALIHLLGFVKGFGLAPVAQLVAPISRPVGALWLLACALLLATAATLAARWPAWWTLGAAALLLSQGLVLLAWSDAKFGTLANLLLLMAVVVGGATARFAADTEGRVVALLNAAPQEPAAAVQQVDVDALPPALRRHLTRAGVVGHPRPQVVRLRQQGAMQLAPGQGFVDVVAQQYFTLAAPAFLWRVKLAMFGLPVVGRDTYQDGHGRMRIEAAGLVPVVDEADAKIDQGALLRFLGEGVWFPAGLLSPHVAWEAGEDAQHEARATMRYQGVEGAADFTFDDAGRFVSLRAQRYRGGGEEGQLTPWSVRATTWARFDVGAADARYSVEVPSEGDVVWHLPEGDFVFYRWTIHALEYDVGEPWPGATTSRLSWMTL
jgi:hypothetical protein